MTLPSSTLSSSRDDELALDLTFSVESDADPTATRQALEQQIRIALAVRTEVRRASELVTARHRIGIHLLVHFTLFCSFRHFAHRALCAARIRAIADADILRLPALAMETTFRPLTFAQRAR